MTPMMHRPIARRIPTGYPVPHTGNNCSMDLSLLKINMS